MNNTMTFNEIEKEFDECWYRDDVKRGLYEGKIDKEWFKSFLKQSFIKYLQSEVERLEKQKRVEDNHTHSEENNCGDCEWNRGNDFGHNQAISDQIIYITNKIKSLEV